MRWSRRADVRVQVMSNLSFAKKREGWGNHRVLRIRRGGSRARGLYRPLKHSSSRGLTRHPERRASSGAAGISASRRIPRWHHLPCSIRAFYRSTVPETAFLFPSSQLSPASADSPFQSAQSSSTAASPSTAFLDRWH
jgi:hypothetical protein